MNFAIVLNLQIIYLHEIITLENLGKFLYTVPILMALTLDLIPFGKVNLLYTNLAMNSYGRDAYNFVFKA